MKTYIITRNPMVHGYDITLKGRKVECVLTLAEAVAYAMNNNGNYKLKLKNGELT
jgi:hypothetical protein